MEGARKFIAQRMGVSRSSIPSTILPPGVKEGTCPLCGHFQPLDKRGLCGMEECHEAASQEARRIAKEAGGNVPGLYYKFGDQEVIILAGLKQWKEPQPVKRPDMCQTGECTEFALPADYLCWHHRITERREKFLAYTREYGRVRRTKRPKQKKGQKRRGAVGNKIRGLGEVKLKK